MDQQGLYERLLLMRINLTYDVFDNRLRTSKKKSGVDKVMRERASHVSRGAELNSAKKTTEHVNNSACQQEEFSCWKAQLYCDLEMKPWSLLLFKVNMY